MIKKEQLREKYFKKRKKNYFEVEDNFFNPLSKIINQLSIKKKIYISFYYPSNYEVNVLNFLKKIKLKKNIVSLLPSIISKNKMHFYSWSYLETLKVNKYGMLEPFITKKNIIPDIILVPLLAYDKKNNRLGYGKGFYDNYLNKYLKFKKKILTIGIAFSFQKYNKLPISKQDVKLDHILTEKGI